MARMLAEQGDEVRGLHRRTDQTAFLKSIGVNGVVGDVAGISEREFASASSSAKATIFTAAAGEQDNDSMIDAVDGDGVRKAIAASRLANISKIILVSVFPEAWRERTMTKGFEHYMAVKKQADVDLVHSGLDWIIIRRSSPTDDPGTVPISLSPAEIHTQVSRDDVAASIVFLFHTLMVRRAILEVTADGTQIGAAVESLSNFGFASSKLN